MNRDFEHRFASYSPSEASRAIKKKLKHGTSHQQYRALVVSFLSLNFFEGSLPVR
jgi:hypothetical protein